MDKVVLARFLDGPLKGTERALPEEQAYLEFHTPVDVGRWEELEHDTQVEVKTIIYERVGTSHSIFSGTSITYRLQE